ncbi:hypothetical protein DMC64_20975 [Amycolatopsis sp. WAC 04197]|uniref:FAD-dependent monooxygenase n=1 Tax=Amycolatopsis sp. WAC 04197 TaxID=2203199 RepID=UPI000F7BA79D|nr:FAD-dependent monooxygenase [Amycolatopsis sp. WAC 04197]RSN43983.1 hypothetical protein DMC64_20975 [Amycolatopsis sp. WAC 04197]
MSEPLVIVGAGPTGLALAVHLFMHDVDVRLVDAAPGPVTTSRALGLQPRGVEVLERIGALGDLRSRSRSLLNMYYNDGPRTVLKLQVGKAAAMLPKPTLLISQAEVEGALRARLAEVGGKVEWGTKVTGARQRADGVTVAVDTDEREIEASWLIGCDGAHSAVRRIAGIGFSGRKLIERLLMADVRANWPFDHDGSVTWMDTGRMLSVTALPDNAWRVFTEPLPGLPEGLSTEQIGEEVLSEFCRRSGLSRDTVTEVRWSSEFRIHRRLADRYRQGRLLLAGDAAHIQSPTGGQGQNTGLGDAENLAWKLTLVARGLAGEELIDTYEGERRPLARKVLAATSGAVDIMLPDRPWKRLVRDRLVMPAIRSTAVQRRLWLVASQLDTTYRGGPLAPGASRWARKPRPGDRVPDLRCRRTDGVETTLHAAISGRWTVVAGDAGQAARHTEAVAGQLGADLVGTLVCKGSRDVLLVRPDGHLAWRGLPAPDKMAAWLNDMRWTG